MPKYPKQPAALSPAAYENIRSCIGIPYADKRTHLLALTACGLDVAAAERIHETARPSRMFRGPAPKKLFAAEGLGVIVLETTFIKFTAGAFGKSIPAFQRQLDLYLSFFDKRDRGMDPSTSEDLAVRSFMNTLVPARADGSIWLFRNPRRTEDAFEGLEDRWLGHRLGLPIASGGEIRLTLGFSAAHAEGARKPTIFDVPWSMLDLWDWRGTTKPLPGTPVGLSGLDEVVCKPPQIGRANRPIRRLHLHAR